jgi:hypothetical protein
VITKVLFSAAIALGAAVGVATPASADPSLFGTLSCSCEAVLDGGAAVTDQMNLGIQSGLAYLPGIPGPAAIFSPRSATGNHLFSLSRPVDLRAAARDRSSR